MKTTIFAIVAFATFATLSQGAEIYISSMKCIQHTNPETGSEPVRDEIYMLISKPGARGAIRLPDRDTGINDGDYYQFWKGTTCDGSPQRPWTNQKEKPVPQPVLWRGQLNRGETVKIAVAIAEQDNKTFRVVADALSTILSATGREEAAAVAATVAGFGPEKDNGIAIIEATLTNANGILDLRTRPLAYATLKGIVFTSKGDNKLCNYEFTVAGR